MTDNKSKIFDSILDTIENEDIKLFAKECIKTIPGYFWNVGASSTGKYHPAYALGDLGLARHTCALVRFLNHILAIDCIGNAFTPREKDLMRVAGMMHDTRKSGDKADYEKSKHTKFDHPLMAAEVVRNVTGIIPQNEADLVSSMIESHMGQWCTDKRSSVVLPVPQNKYQKLVHLADYLASRKDIEVLFGEEYSRKTEVPSVDGYIFTFGKHKGEKLLDVKEKDADYIRWLKENITKEPLATLLKQV